ncbi:MAG TPA: class I SAM-dependent methyltransferase [Candidatus Binataceae bacterium]|nr:class I SAM-dependent methyltransferase [Candidatus Binataceae bacterium]
MFALLPEGFDPVKLYNDAYFTGTDGYGFNDYDLLWSKCCGRFYVPRLTRMLDFHEAGSLLDIGCAGGQFITEAQARGWQVAGIEPAPAMRQQAADSLHCTVFDSIEQALRSGQRFDCVSMFEVIEHLVDPVATLREVAGLLKPGGVIALSTPNCGRPDAALGKPINIWFCPPLHISYFDPATFGRCVRLAGLEPLATDGLEHYCRAMAGEVVLPEWLVSVLRPIRRGKRLRPHGAIGRLLKRLYKDRVSLYQRRQPADLSRTDVLELYASRPG